MSNDTIDRFGEAREKVSLFEVALDGRGITFQRIAKSRTSLLNGGIKIKLAEVMRSGYGVLVEHFFCRFHQGAELAVFGVSVHGRIWFCFGE